MMTFKPQLVHESETQRQHVRVELPAAKAILRDQQYSVQNISVGGVQLKDVPAKFQKHEKAVIELTLPFEAFALNIKLPCVIEHYDAKGKILGCAFTMLTEAQISLLTVVIKSRMAGTIIDAGDILHIAGRNNFTTLKRDPGAVPLTTSQKIKRSSIFAAFLLLGLACLWLIGGNLYERFNVIQAAQAYVTADTIKLKAPVNGEFQSMLGESISKLRTGQIVGQIKTYVPSQGNDGELVQSSISVTSPCDCTIITKQVDNGEFRMIGEPIMELLVGGTAPNIKAQVPMNTFTQIRAGQHADIILDGKTFSGSVLRIEMAVKIGETSAVLIKPERPLPLSSLGKPVSVKIRKR